MGNAGKHPSALGRRIEEVWPEISHFIKPLIDQMRGDGEATRSGDVLIPVPKREIEDVYWTFSYSPAYGDKGNANGAFVTCTGKSAKINVLRKSEESNSQLAFTIEPVGLGAFDFNPLTDIFSSNRIS